MEEVILTIKINDKDVLALITECARFREISLEEAVIFILSEETGYY